MPSRYPEEFKAIKDARDAAPNESAKGLAMKLAGTPGLACRTFYSVYSVIRRHDASKKAVATATSTVKGKKLAKDGHKLTAAGV